MKSITSRKIYSMDYYSKNNDVLRKSIVVIEVDHELNSKNKEMLEAEYKEFIDYLEKVFCGKFEHKKY